MQKGDVGGKDDCAEKSRRGAGLKLNLGCRKSKPVRRSVCRAGVQSVVVPLL